MAVPDSVSGVLVRGSWRQIFLASTVLHFSMGRQRHTTPGSLSAAAASRDFRVATGILNQVLAISSAIARWEGHLSTDSWKILRSRRCSSSFLNRRGLGVLSLRGETPRCLSRRVSKRISKVWAVEGDAIWWLLYAWRAKETRLFVSRAW